MTIASRAELLRFTVEVARDAGAIALKYFRTAMPVTNKSTTSRFDPVTEADREVERLIRRRIEAAYPAHGIVGEEEASRAGDGIHQWVIDPIDGTRAFISGIPLWGILLGLQIRNECILGALHQPFLGETFTGVRDGKATFENAAGLQTIRTRQTTDLADAILYSTHPSIFGQQNDLDRFHKVAGHCRLMRYGGDCYLYGLLAAGHIDLVIEGGLAPYDIIPLIPIIEAAGGVVSNWEGGSAIGGGRIVAAATPELHQAALSLLV